MSAHFTLKSIRTADGARANVTVRDGRITAIGSQVEGEAVDCEGMLVTPGFVDLHSHLREPGFEDSETILSGSKSGVAGGYTALQAMANTNPVADSVSVVNKVYELGLAAGLLEVQPVGSITKGLLGEELTPLAALRQSKARVRYFSDDGVCVSNRLLMRDALAFSAKTGVVIAQHAQDPHLTIGSQMNDGALADELGLKGWPAVAEELVIASDIALALATGGHLHVCHLTTAAGLDIVRWGKSKGANITCEVTPHHLLLTEDLVAGYDATFKVNPPLRRSEDVAALRKGLADGTIDAIATDHAPHSIEKKECEWESAAFGMVGLEVAASVAIQVLAESMENWHSRFVEVLSTNPARIGQFTDQGRLEVGAVANLTVIDTATTREITRATRSKSLNNPFAGLQLPGSVQHTIYKGKFTMQSERLTDD